MSWWVWSAAAGYIQKTAELPIPVKLGEEKRPFALAAIPARDIFDLVFWQAKNTTYTRLYLRAKTNVENVVLSDRFGTVLQVGYSIIDVLKNKIDVALYQYQIGNTTKFIPDIDIQLILLEIVSLKENLKRKIDEL